LHIIYTRILILGIINVYQDAQIFCFILFYFSSYKELAAIENNSRGINSSRSAKRNEKELDTKKFDRCIKRKEKIW
jgi:hypothetical protein